MKHPLAAFLIFSSLLTSAQDLKLVWEDNFDGPEIDRSIWTFEEGPTNDNIHYYTDRTDNARIEEGVLKLISLEEAYEGFSYTSALIKTAESLNWRYGRVEASIRLPATKGFVPAFWMLPVDNMYGWWPYSGEIDIMEHPTNSVTTIHGTVHTETYNLFDGPKLPQGGTVDIPDAESAFHVYAVEWSPEQIDFYVDDQKYYTFLNDQGASDTWPFDQPFYIILNLAVGGGWVGDPDQTTVFPAVMEVDYVKVWQQVDHIDMMGEDFLTYHSEAVSYQATALVGANHQWNVPGGAEIVFGRGTERITVDWGLFGGTVYADFLSSEGTHFMSFPVRVSENVLKNPGFEKGVKYWTSRVAYPAEADFRLDAAEVHGGAHSLFVEVRKPGANAWDIQLSQGALQLEGGKKYQVSFWARSAGAPESITAAIINSSSFALIGSKTVALDENWALVEFSFIAPSSAPLALNIDLGDHGGSYYFDDFLLTNPELEEMNLIENGDFFEGEEGWDFELLSTAQATGSVENGAFYISIANAGTETWDIHLEQSGLLIEQGEWYELSFDGDGTSPRTISAFIGKDAEPWTVYSGDREISLTRDRENYAFTFVMNDPTDSAARLSFDVGGDPEGALLDNVLLRKVDPDPTSVQATFGQGSGLALRVLPNPFRSKTSFHYTLQEPSVVTLTIFNQAGQKTGTLLHKFQQEGSHELIWNAEDHPPGVYFYHLQSEGATLSGKLVVLE